MTSMNHEQLVKAFKALANEGRLRILEAIRDSEMQCACQAGKAGQDEEECCGSTKPPEPRTCCVEDIVGQFDIAQSTVSQHLKELHNAGLLDRHKKAQWVYYTVNRKAYEDVVAYLQGFSPLL
jgi:DNA-binding transcriptional ArsR family regulator